MVGIGYQLLHSDAFSAELEALGLGSSLFGAAGIPAPIFQALVPRRAGVFDANANTFGTGTEPATHTRASDGIYLDADGNYQMAADNAIRAEYHSNGDFLGYLFEPARTNKCENYNAAPDAGLTGISANGTTVTRVSNPAAIAAAKLSGLCTEGNVVQIENASGVNKYPSIAGTTGNTNAHNVSVWINTFGDTISLGMSAGDKHSVATSELTRFEHEVTPTATNAAFQFLLNDGEKIQFVLNQLEESAVPSSPIVTTGASATRAIDALSWAAAPAGVDLAVGTIALRVSRPIDYAGQTSSRPICTLQTSHGAMNLINIAASGNQVWRTSDGTNTVQKSEGTPAVAFEAVTIFVTWSGSSLVLHRYTTALGWSTTSGTFDGAMTSNDVLQVFPSINQPQYISDLRIWNRALTQSEIRRLF